MSIYLEFDYDPAVWLELPHFDEYSRWQDPKAWAAELADDVWADSGLRPRKGEVANLAEVLTYLAERSLRDDTAEVENFFHLPHPQGLPQRLKVWIAHDPGATLRDWVLAEDSEAIEPPIVEPFVSERLGAGLRALRTRVYVPDSGEQAAPGGLYSVLRYAWPADGEDTAVVVTTAMDDLAALHKALPDIDAFARGIYLIRDDAE